MVELLTKPRELDEGTLDGADQKLSPYGLSPKTRTMIQGVRLIAEARTGLIFTEDYLLSKTILHPELQRRRDMYRIDPDQVLRLETYPRIINDLFVYSPDVGYVVTPHLIVAHLDATENKILEYLTRMAGKLILHEEIEEIVSPSNTSYPLPRANSTITQRNKVRIARLRGKIGDRRSTGTRDYLYIQNFKDAGYLWRMAIEALFSYKEIL